MNNWLFVTVLIVLASIWHWFHNVKSQSIRKVRVHTKQEPQRFHGVSIHPCAQPCEQVHSMRKIRFLSRETPNLPIDGCNNQDCTCSYTHHKDRRHIDDRRFINSFSDNERRIKIDRRDQSFA